MDHESISQFRQAKINGMTVKIKNGLKILNGHRLPEQNSHDSHGDRISETLSKTHDSVHCN